MGLYLGKEKITNVASQSNNIVYVPEVSSEGILSWTNTGGAKNPDPVNIKGETGPQGPQGISGPTGPRGLQGEQGPRGAGLVILGYYATEAALTAAVTSPAAGDAYGVGTAEPYDIYVWDGVGSKWVNNGTAVGVEGNYLAKDDPTGTGMLTMTATDMYGVGLSFNRKSGTRIGYGSYALGGPIYSDEYGPLDYSAEASGRGSAAIGNSAKAAGNDSFCFGPGRATQEYSVAFNGAADGKNSFAGPFATAAGHSSVAFGLRNRAVGFGQVVIGGIAEKDTLTDKAFYSEKLGHYVFIIGGGWESVGTERTLLTVDWDGNLRTVGTLEGTALILKSSTEGSSKRFRITVDDSGALHTEVLG